MHADPGEDSFDPRHPPLGPRLSEADVFGLLNGFWLRSWTTPCRVSPAPITSLRNRVIREGSLEDPQLPSRSFLIWPS